MEGCGIRDELIAEAVEALVCKTSLSGFESHRYLHFSLRPAEAPLRTTRHFRPRHALHHCSSEFALHICNAIAGVMPNLRKFLMEAQSRCFEASRRRCD